MVLEDVTELYVMLSLFVALGWAVISDRIVRGSDYSGSHTKLPKILLNGNNICMVMFALSVADNGANLTTANSWRRGTYPSRWLIEM